MHRVRNSRGYQRPYRQGTSRHNLALGCNALRQEQMREQLHKETTNCSSRDVTIASLRQELEETKEQLKRQKTLKEMYINKEKETRRELERLKKYSDEKTLNTAKIATQVRETAKRKKKKLLQVDYEELQVAHLISREKFAVELETETQRNKLLQEELETVNSSHQVNQQYGTEMASVQKQVEILQCNLEKEGQQKTLLLKYYEDLQEINRHNQEKFTAELQEERQKSKVLEQELDRVRRSSEEDHARYEAEVNIVKQRADILQGALERERQQMTDLRKEFEELQAERRRSQEALSAEPQEERQKSKVLQEEMENLKVSYHEISQRYETVVLTARQQIDELKGQLDREMNAHKATVAEGWSVINGLRAEQAALSQQVTEEKNNALEKKRLYESELNDLKTQLETQISLNLERSSELPESGFDTPTLEDQEADEVSEDILLESSLDTAALEDQELDEVSEDILLESSLDSTTLEDQEADEISEDILLESSMDTAALKDQQEDQVSQDNLPETAKMPSAWKRARHFLGLRKPEKWKKKKN